MLTVFDIGGALQPLRRLRVLSEHEGDDDDDAAGLDLVPGCSLSERLGRSGEALYLGRLSTLLGWRTVCEFEMAIGINV